MLEFIHPAHIFVPKPLYKVKEPSTPMDLEERYDKIYRYCFRRLQDRQAAEDVTQETFVRFLGAEGYRGQGKTMGYLYAIARNLCADQYRRPAAAPLPDDLPAPDRTEDELTLLALRQALASLPEEEQELVLLRYVNQEPVSVIADALGLSRFAVYRRTRAALEKLRRMLEEDEA